MTQTALGALEISMHRPLGYGSPADQRLSSSRMSMLAHGFVDREDGDRHEYVPDESGGQVDMAFWPS